MKEAKVIFRPEDRAVAVPTRTNLVVAASLAGINIYAPCGDRGVCGKCKVQAWGQLTALTQAERGWLAPAEIEEGWRLACQAVVEGDVVVQLPIGRLQYARIAITETVGLAPNVRKIFLELPQPSLDDQRSDLSRLKEGLGMEETTVHLSVLRNLPRVLQESGYKVTAVLVGEELIAVEKGDTTALNFGLAFDIGTTTVVGMLLDLHSGRQLAVSPALNAQANYGADVVSRIALVMNEPSGLNKLQHEVSKTINGIIGELLQQTGVRRENIYEATIVGNTCMHHLLLGIKPISLAVAPYAPVVTDPLAVKAKELGIDIHPRASVFALPNIAGFVGSDTVGVILATGLHRSEEIKLAIDIGTNGEIVLGNKDRLLACSTAAGPAFEGAHIMNGMRGTEGAIERVWIDDDVKVQVIGRRKPRGICGSGLIDAVAEMYRAGVIDQSGRLINGEEAADRLPKSLSSRLITTTQGPGFVLYSDRHSAVVITQRDIRELQLAKGAIRAGIEILKKELGIEDDQITEVLLAGAFGSYVHPPNVVAIGLIPPLPEERLVSVGNAASVGSRMALLSMAARDIAKDIARRVQYIELSARPDFQEKFVAALSLPSSCVANEIRASV
ncbi:MAG: ASKHA domain-containing protein [Chloroflexi bacterium]|nr:ASKHA domain-containing protein [Chloroflexota bacterium]